MTDGSALLIYFIMQLVQRTVSGNEFRHKTNTQYIAAVVFEQRSSNFVSGAGKGLASPVLTECCINERKEN